MAGLELGQEVMMRETIRDLWHIAAAALRQARGVGWFFDDERESKGYPHHGVC